MNDIIKLINSTKGLKLLYVEDNIDARESTHIMLEDFFNNIEVALDGVDGLEKFKNSEFDIIITDINMPNMNGMDMIKSIRAIDLNIPIILLSAYSQREYEKEMEELNINGFLLKPVLLEQFVKQLSFALGV